MARPTALLDARLPDGREAPRQRVRHPVEACHRHLAGHVDSVGAQVVHRREGEHVGGAHQRRDARIDLERELGRRATGARQMVVALHDRQRIRLQASVGHGVQDPVDAVALHVEMRRLHALGVGDRALAAPCGQSRPNRMVSSPISACPRPITYSATLRIAARSSMHTREAPGTSLG